MEIITINKRNGIYFSKKSGDHNKIHIDELTGYNSQFGENIIHGALLAIRILKYFIKKNQINLKEQGIRFYFLNYAKYGEKIKIKKTKENLIFIQNNKIIVKANLFFYENEKIEINKIRKRFNLNKKLINNIDFENILMLISKYVGTIYPGEHSIIRRIDITNQIKENDKNEIISWKLDDRTPIIQNILKFKNIFSYFESLERPQILKKKFYISKDLQSKIKSLEGNVLIIGASSGIGNEVLELLKINSNINLFASYYKNKILNKFSYKKIKFLKLDITKDILKFKKLISESNFSIYYFASPPIKLEKVKSLNLIYKKYYYDFLEKLIIHMGKQKYNYKIFYPSTSFINTEDKSSYTKTKLYSETKIKSLIKNYDNIKVNILRIERVLTKNNLSFFQNTVPSFTELLNNNKAYQSKFFFENLT